MHKFNLRFLIQNCKDGNNANLKIAEMTSSYQLKSGDPLLSLERFQTLTKSGNIQFD